MLRRSGSSFESIRVSVTELWGFEVGDFGMKKKSILGFSRHSKVISGEDVLAKLQVEIRNCD